MKINLDEELVQQLCKTYDLYRKDRIEYLVKTILLDKNNNIINFKDYQPIYKNFIGYIDNSILYIEFFIDYPVYNLTFEDIDKEDRLPKIINQDTKFNINEDGWSWCGEETPNTDKNHILISMKCKCNNLNSIKELDSIIKENNL